MALDSNRRAPQDKEGKKKNTEQIIRHAVVLVECELFLGNSISKKVSKETFFPRLMTAVARHLFLFFKKKIILTSVLSVDMFCLMAFQVNPPQLFQFNLPFFTTLNGMWTRSVRKHALAALKRLLAI